MAKAPVKSRHVLEPKAPAPKTAQGRELLSGILEAAMEGIETAGSKKSTTISPAAVDNSKTVIRQDMKEAIQASPEFQHITNSEPWFTKRSRWAAIIGPASMVIGIGLKLSGVDFNIGPSEQALVADALTAVGAVVAGWFAYRAGTATKPLGS